MNTESQTYAALMAQSHNAVLNTFQRLAGQDLHHRFHADGRTLNSAFWILAHLTGTQNWLVLRGSGGPFRKYSWAKHFGMGSAGTVATEEYPAFNEVLEMYKAVHIESIAHVSTLDDAALAAPHQALLNLPAGNDVRTVIKHHILHESGHCGQLAWLCKLYGLRTI
jgi:hypothetical protein